MTVTFNPFQGYGKDFMKQVKIHPDAFIQAAIQLTYYRLHDKIGSTYETATMREYYHGRTETVRSCDMAMLDMCKEWSNPDSKVSSISISSSSLIYGSNFSA